MWDFIQIQLDSDWAVSILENKCSIEVVIHDLYDDDGGFQSDPVNTSDNQWVPVGSNGF